MKAVAFDRVSFGYQRCSIFTQLSFSIEMGECVGVIGPNGGGKTTALKLMLGLLKPDKGKIRVFSKAPRIARSRIGYVPQVSHYDPFFPISLMEMVLVGNISQMRRSMTFPSTMKEKAKELLTMLGLLPLQKTPIGALSGGQMQKALIARALFSDPELLLLDEPTANIDSESEASILALLDQIKGGKTVVIVTHNLEEVKDHTDRVLCFQNGVSSFHPGELCAHTSMGIYHSPSSPP